MGKTREEFFTDTSLHNPNGKLYQKMGFEDCGDSDSAWGGEKWHEMKYIL